MFIKCWTTFRQSNSNLNHKRVAYSTKSDLEFTTTKLKRGILIEGFTLRSRSFCRALNGSGPRQTTKAMSVNDGFNHFWAKLIILYHLRLATISCVLGKGSKKNLPFEGGFKEKRKENQNKHHL